LTTDFKKLKLLEPLNNKKVLAKMQKKTRSLLEELDAMYIERDQRHVIENRATNVIASAIRLLEQIEENYTPPAPENPSDEIDVKDIPF
jgi:hypothetical protein